MTSPKAFLGAAWLTGTAAEGAVVLTGSLLLLAGCAPGVGPGPAPEPGRPVMAFSEPLYSGPGYELYLRNDSDTPVTITEILFTRCENVAGDCRLRNDPPFVIDPGDWRRVYTVEPYEADRAFGVRWTYRYQAGRLVGATAEATDAPPALILEEADGYRLLMDPRGTFVNLVLPGSRPDESSEFAQRVTNTLYRHFRDEFDFVLFSFPDGERPATVAGRSTRVRNDVSGIGMPVRVNVGTAGWGSESRLRGVLFLAQHRFLDTGIVLHEIAHNWGQTLLPEPGDGHWGFAGVGGLLGGWEPGTLEEAGTGSWVARGPDGSPGFLLYGPTQEGIAQRLKPYAPLELYLMGLLPADSVPDFRIAEGAEWLIEDAGVFRADNVRTVTMDEIVETFGPRDPAARTGQTFRAIYVLVSPEPLSDGARELIHADIVEFSRPAPREERRRYYNFWEATGGRASIVMDGLGELLQEPF